MELLIIVLEQLEQLLIVRDLRVDWIHFEEIVLAIRMFKER